MTKEYYSVKEFAELMGFTIGGVYKMIKEGRLAAVQVGNSYRISAKVLEEKKIEKDQ